MKTRFTSLTLLTIFFLFSCKTSTNKIEYPLAESAMEVSPTADNRSGVKIENPIERKIIKTGEIQFETTNIEQTESLILKTISELGGYVSNDNIFNSEDRITHRMILRVPDENFDQLLEKISSSVRKLDTKNVDVQDVTEEYIDIESRIKTKKELENRYKELLGRADKVEDILSIEKEIGTLRTEIESIEGRLKYLNDRISFSTLTVEFYQFKVSSFAFASRFGQALIMGWKWLLGFIIGLIHLWPFILLIGGGIFLTVRMSRKKKKQK